MSRLRERLYKEYKLEELGYDFLGYTFESKKELSTHHIMPRHIGGKTEKKNLCVLNRYTSHNYIHLIEDTDYNIFLRISSYLAEQVKKGEISRDELLRINDLLEAFERKYKDEESRNGSLIIKEEYKTNYILI
mgnify:CR=1 FL=1